MLRVFTCLVHIWLLIPSTLSTAAYEPTPKSYTCSKQKCILNTPPTRPGLGLQACWLACGKYGSLWPRPAQADLDQLTVQSFSVQRTVEKSTAWSKGADQILMNKMLMIFVKGLNLMLNTTTTNDSTVTSNAYLDIQLAVRNPAVDRVTLDTDESYSLSTKCGRPGGAVNVKITAETCFGARHALTTLEQLVVVDDVGQRAVIVCGANVTDRPSYPYRGILIDTSRNFIPVGNLEKLIDAMSLNKMNRLHWHMVDSTSFPIQIQAFPHMSASGAYGPGMVYSREQMAGLVDYALVRGVGIVPEFDTPGHVSAGWDWGTDSKYGDLLLCRDMRCVSVPCSTLNVTNPRVYDVLEIIYGELLDLFKPDLFHMGGDEVKPKCWKSLKAIDDWLVGHGHSSAPANEDSAWFYYLWDHFQRTAHARLKKAREGRDKDVAASAVLWTSTLTADRMEMLDADAYIIEIWSSADQEDIREILSAGFRVITSPADVWYLDCGYGLWVGEGVNWCSPYHDWPRMYDYRPWRSITPNKWSITDSKLKSQILGGEGSMWTEQVDHHALEGKVWPRAAAIAERLWSDPEECWVEAYQRMNLHRFRMVQKGVQADALTPLRCLEDDTNCLYGPKDWKELQFRTTTCWDYYRDISFWNWVKSLPCHWLIFVSVVLVVVVGVASKLFCKRYYCAMVNNRAHRLGSKVGYSVLKSND